MTNPFKRKLILVVCTGNTCRSPMGAALLRKKLGWLGRLQYKVRSAGLHAVNGEPATKNAILAMANQGISIKRHKATALTNQIIKDAFAILGMTEHHCQKIRELKSNCPVLRFFVGRNILDPYGQSLARYIETAKQLSDAGEKLVPILRI